MEMPSIFIKSFRSIMLLFCKVKVYLSNRYWVYKMHIPLSFASVEFEICNIKVKSNIVSLIILRRYYSSGILQTVKRDKCNK